MDDLPPPKIKDAIVQTLKVIAFMYVLKAIYHCLLLIIDNFFLKLER